MATRALLSLAVLLPLAVPAQPADESTWPWITVNADNTPRVLPAPPAGQDWQQACSCRPAYVGQDGALWRQCLCTAPSLEAPDLQAPLAWIVQRAEAPDPQERQLPL
jgi:hypothetical protein